MRKLAIGIAAAAVITLVLGAAANGFESSLERIPPGAANAGAAGGQGPLVLGAPLPVTVDAFIVDTENGAAAVVVTIKNPGPASVNAPVSVELLDASGAVVGTNVSAGTDLELNHIPALPQGDSMYVSDGVAFSATPATARVKAAAGTAGVARVMEVQGAKVDSSIYGPVVVGTLSNPGRRAARNVLVEAVVRSGGTVVAAGSARVEAVKAGGKASFQILLVGDPKGGTATAWTPGAP